MITQKEEPGTALEAALDLAIDLATAIDPDDGWRRDGPIDDADRLGRLIEQAGRAVRDPRHETAALAAAAMRWSEDIDGRDIPQRVRRLARDVDADDVSRDRLRTANRLLLQIARAGLLLIGRPDGTPSLPSDRTFAMSDVAVIAIRWLAIEIEAAPAAATPARRDPVELAAEEILCALETDPAARALDMDTRVDVALAAAGRLHGTGWLTPPEEAGKR